MTQTSDDSQELPDVFDVLVVGGGPGGTATAFRARELGLTALVIDYDDLMKRIRDYSKDKLILPGFGGGDRMKFPRGGPLVSALHFSAIDKDEMCAQWKGFYHQHGVPARVGVELTGIERRGDTYHVLAYDHGARRDVTFLARHVVLAIGRGVPRRFDIPGDTDGIAYRLSEPQRYVGTPSCVVGGGTSAAEAVIAISNAKAQAQDPTRIFWSYRGDKLPRVSKALAEVFFEAYVGNGNIQYCPRSEPAAIVVAEDRREYLAVRIDRRVSDGRPHETTHLEFPKEDCIACIGEDIPEALLGSLGISMVTGGPRNKRRMVVNRYLESRLPNVYLIGDLLSQAYFETDDFDADPAGLREVKHRGNVKSALRDGVLVAEVIRQKIDGREQIEVHIEDAPDPTPAKPPRITVSGPLESPGPPEESLEADRQVAQAEAFLVRVLPSGVHEGEYPVPSNAVTTLGRRGCDVSFPNDTLLAERHASISHTEDGYFLRDDGSTSGVFLRVPAAHKQEVGDGDLIRAGRQFLLFAVRDGDVSVTHYDAQGNEVGRHRIPQRPMVLGRQAPDVTLDAQDRTLSRRQLALSVEGGKVFVKDLKSVNGTYLRVKNAIRLEHGHSFRIGQQLLTLSVGEDAVLDTPEAPRPRPVHRAEVEAARVSPPETPPSPPAAAGEAPEGPSVSFKGSGRVLTVKPGQTLCEAAEEHGIDITAECHSGICGSDPIRILSGADQLDTPPGDQESETLEELCDLSPGECRLACMVRVKGPVEVEILKSG